MTSNRFSKTLYAAAMAALFGLYGGTTIAAEQTTTEPITKERLVTASATVKAVDMKTRELTLKDPDGNEFNVTAGPEVKNLAQVKVGDQVLVGYYQSLTLQLNKEIVEKGNASEFALFTAEPGSKPAAAGTHEVNVTAEVTGIDHENNTVTLKGPERTVQLPIEDPDVLAKLKVGDKIHATYTEALAVSVEPAPKQ